MLETYTLIMMKIVFLPEVIQYFNELVTILYKKNYFGFEENAYNYVVSLLDEIEETLPFRVSKIAPPYFNRYGKAMRYASFRKNKTTQWYVFFTKYQQNDETIYLIRYITNNHVNAHHL